MDVYNIHCISCFWYSYQNWIMRESTMKKQVVCWLHADQSNLISIFGNRNAFILVLQKYCTSNHFHSPVFVESVCVCVYGVCFVLFNITENNTTNENFPTFNKYNS